MDILKVFKRTKRRKYPIIRDEKGKSARKRCFEMFEEQVPFEEIAAATGAKLNTVYRYHRQWLKNPGIETTIKYFKKLLNPLAPNRERQIELIAQVLGFSKEQVETTLRQPHGLRRLFSGKIYFPKQAEADHKCYIAMEIANLISDHLLKNGGKLEDVKYAFDRWMKENQINREEEDEDNKEENENIAFARKLIEADVEDEKQGRIKPDRLSEQEVTAIDFSEKFIAIAKLKDNRNIEYEVIDTTDENHLKKLPRNVFDSIVCTMAIMDMEKIDVLINYLPKMLKKDGVFIFSSLHPCFNSGDNTLAHERCDLGGKVKDKYFVKISNYLIETKELGIGMLGQPKPQYYFHRPISTILRHLFENGFVLDAFEEPSFTSIENSNSIFDNVFKHTPPALICRLKIK